MPTPRSDVAHLLRRAGFGGTAAEVTQLAQLGLPEIVDRLINVTPSPAANPEFLTPGKDPGSFGFDVTNWWIGQMASTSTPLVEKMALHWHGHFVSSQMKASMPAMWQQNQLFRTSGLGSFEKLALNVFRGPAMITYLDNNTNTKDKRNENFARESLELFMLGVDQYTQADVVANAKAWTGHGVTEGGNQYRFDPTQHDNSQKTFLGVTANWNGPDIVHFLCTDAKYRNIVARHVATRMWKFFATQNPPAVVVTALANAFVASNMNIKALLRTLFLRPEFYSVACKQGHIRSPAEWLTAIARYSGKTPTQLRSDYFWGNWNTMGQSLFYPPGVDGWPGGRSWVSSSAIWAKGNFASGFAAADAMKDVLAKTAPLTVAQAVQKAFDTFGIDQVSANTRRAMETQVAADRRDGKGHERTTLIVMTLLSPEFQVA